MTEAAYAHMFGLAERLAGGLRELIARQRLAWCVTRIGARTEFQFTPQPPRNGSQAEAILDPALERNIHLYLLNRGLVITPFHNMLLVCPDTTAADIDRLVAAIDEFVAETVSG
jgi:glutamate-1-semialdehyde 2,1-aminomutase